MIFALLKNKEKENPKILTMGPNMSAMNISLSIVTTRTSSARAKTTKRAPTHNLRIFKTHQGIFLLWLLLRKYISRGENRRRKKTGAYEDSVVKAWSEVRVLGIPSKGQVPERSSTKIH